MVSLDVVRLDMVKLDMVRLDKVRLFIHWHSNFRPFFFAPVPFDLWINKLS